MEVIPGLLQNPSNDLPLRLVPRPHIRQERTRKARVEGEDHAIPGLAQSSSIFDVLPYGQHPLHGSPQFILRIPVDSVRSPMIDIIERKRNMCVCDQAVTSTQGGTRDDMISITSYIYLCSEGRGEASPAGSTMHSCVLNISWNVSLSIS